MREKLSRKPKYDKLPPKEELTIPLQLLQALRDCNSSTRRGFVDKGNPKKLMQLAMWKLVESRNGGFVTTDDGRAYLASHNRELMKL